jgi:hypothetical protein
VVNRYRLNGLPFDEALPKRGQVQVRISNVADSPDTGRLGTDGNGGERGRLGSCPSSIYPGTVWLPGDRYVLTFHVFQQALGSAFATDAALFHATEGCGGVRDQAAIQPNHAALQLLADTQPAR